MREGAKGEEERLAMPPQRCAQRSALRSHAMPHCHTCDGGEVECRHCGRECCGERGAGFVAASISCGLCQFLRAEEDKAARQVYTWLGIAKRSGVSLGSFIYVLELGFMLFENLLFLVFLFGMTSGLRVSNS